MVKSFNPEQAALADIVARPEVTGGVETAAQVAPEPKGKANIQPVNMDPAEDDRNGRLMASAFSSAFKVIKGEELGKDHASAAAEIGAYISSVMRQFAVPRGVYAAFLGLVLAAPMAAIAFQVFRPKEGPSNGN